MQTLIVLLVVTGVFGFIWYIFVLAKQQARKKEEAYAITGFSRIEQPESSLLEQLKALYKRTKGDIKIENIYRRNMGYHELYIYDVDSGGDSGSDTHTALYLPDITLPPFAVYPGIRMNGMVGKLLNRLLLGLASRSGFKEVSLPGQSRFSEKYSLMALEEFSLKKKLPDSFWGELAGIPGYLMINAGGNFLSFSVAALDPNRQFTPRRIGLEKYLQNTLDMGQRLSRLLRDISRSIEPASAR